MCRKTICCTLRSRAPVPLISISKSLTPFLYQTATIQAQWDPSLTSTRIFSNGRRNGSWQSRTRGGGDSIPFADAVTTEAEAENGADVPLPPSIDGPKTSPVKTTITGPERAAFERLYKAFEKDEQPQDKLPFRHEVDQIADEWYEEEDDTDAEDLDAVFDAVLAGNTQKKTSVRASDDLRTLADEILKGKDVQGGGKEKTKPKEDSQHKINAQRGQHQARVQQHLDAAASDIELWNVLQREVFAPMRELDLDNKPHRAASRSKSPATKANRDLKTDPRILFHNFPAHLVHAARLFQTSFPSSPLAFSILPTMKSLGRSSYALGASTELYNILLRSAWLQRSSHEFLDSLLRDMDNGGVEFNLQTLRLLGEILGECDAVARGSHGATMQKIYQMEYFRQGVEKLRRWGELCKERVKTVWEAQS